MTQVKCCADSGNTRFIWEARLWTDPQPFTLVIEIDAWNIRERDDWGQNKELLLQDKKPERWH